MQFFCVFFHVVSPLHAVNLGWGVTLTLLAIVCPASTSCCLSSKGSLLCKWGDGEYRSGGRKLQISGSIKRARVFWAINVQPSKLFCWDLNSLPQVHAVSRRLRSQRGAVQQPRRHGGVCPPPAAGGNPKPAAPEGPRGRHRQGHQHRVLATWCGPTYFLGLPQSDVSCCCFAFQRMQGRLLVG